MIPEERAFPDFASGVLLGLYKAYLTDIDVFLIITAGFLAKRRSGLLAGLGRGLWGYVMFRRADGYVKVLATQLARLAAVRDVNPTSTGGVS